MTTPEPSPPTVEQDSAALTSHDTLLACATATSPFSRVWESVTTLERLLETELTGNSCPSSPLVDQLQQVANALREAEFNHCESMTQSETRSSVQESTISRSATIIEELRQAKSELSEARLLAERQREERLRLMASVFENAQEGVVILNSEAHIREVNPVFARIVDRPAERLVGRPLSAVLEWAFPDYEDVLQAVMNGRGWTGRVVVASRERRERTFLLSFSPVTDETQQANVIVMFSDVTDIDRTQRRLKRMALHDQLTGLPNRRFYRERIRSLIEQCRGDHSSFAVCFIDLDDFKHVNDSLGHKAGDQLLVEVARRLRRSAGDEAFVSRFGGDEFAILIPRTDDDIRKTAIVTDTVLRALREPICVANTQACIGASLGVTEYPTHSRDLDELLQNADVAMYSAKESGRNQVCVFAPEMRWQVEQRNQIHNELRRALAGNEISLRYQPQIDLRTGHMAGCEALARWTTPDGRDISPMEFVPVAEKSGLVVPLGELVLIAACKQLSEWDALRLRPPKVAINISSEHLHSPRFAQRVEEILSETNVEPQWLMLEITENAAMHDVTHAMHTMDALAGMGVSLAIDDFGTGHSTLSHLNQFNVHTLKIDRSFVKDIATDRQAQSIVETMVHLGQGRDLTVVAEGIEDQQQLVCLRDIGCDVGQGFHIARPLRATALECWWDEAGIC